MTGSELTLDFLDEDFSIETEYDATKYDADQQSLLEDYLEELAAKMKELTSLVEPGEIDIQDDKMDWSNNWSWEKVLVTVKSN
jgi:hypothetical protein